ncbi:MAG: carbohydrate ABC transporter permease [Clostridiales bacterium]|nr:carbohydrate ABC transporter permease [Clostridiales bacterium]
MLTERSPGSRAFDALNIAFLLLLTLTCVLPIWYTLCVSLSDKSAVAAGAVTLWPVGLTFASYNQIVGDAHFYSAFLTSVKRVLLGTAVSMVCVTMCAYPLSKTNREFPGRGALMWTLLFCMLFSGGLVPWYTTMLKLGMRNNIWGLVLGNSLPMFNVVLVMNFFRNLPREMEEAAVVDGAGAWYIFLRICLPVSLPVLATVTLFTAVYHWNEFFNGLVLTTKTQFYPLQTYIQQLVVQIDTTTMSEDQLKRLSLMSNQTLNAAKLFIAMVPVLLLYPFLQKYFIHGITIGSVKE